jgi:hypothetical protein
VVLHRDNEGAIAMKRVFFFLCAVMFSISCAHGGVLSMVINEWNCVGPTKYLEGPTNHGEGTDSFFGHVAGNGDNWVELVVVQDHLDIRSWAINWSNNKDGVVKSGGMTFTNHSIWSDLRQGTIIGLREYDTSGGDIKRPSDITSYDPYADKWTIFADMDDTALIAKGSWKIDNDLWKATILNANGQTEQGYVGEAGSGAVYETHGNINSQEVGALGINPNVDTSEFDYNVHGSSSSFLAPNPNQDFSAMRNAIVPEPASMILMLCGATAIFGVSRFRK